MAAYIEWVRQFCRSLPHTTEKVRWEHNLLFCVGDKIYCVANLEPGMGPSRITFKCTPEVFTEMIEREGIIPAPYMAHNHWVSVTDLELFRQPELKDRIATSFHLVLGKLPKKTQAKLGATTSPPASARKHSKSRSKPAARRRK